MNDLILWETKENNIKVWDKDSLCHFSDSVNFYVEHHCKITSLKGGGDVNLRS